MKRETWLTQPLRLLYWVFFKPITLANYQRAFDVKTDNRGDFSLLSARREIRRNPALRQYFGQMFLANAYGLALGLLVLMPLAEGLRALLTPDATFNLLNIAFGVAVGVAVGVAAGVAVGVTVGVTYGMAVGVAVGVVVGVVRGVEVGIVAGVTYGMVVGVVAGVAFGVALGVWRGVAAGVEVGLMAGVVVGIMAGVVVSVALAVAVGVYTIVITWLFYFRIPLYLAYVPWNTTAYFAMRNALGNAVSWYRRCPQNWDELIWFRLFFLDGQLVALTQADRAAGLAAIDAVAASFRQGWAARRAVERLLVDEFAQVDTVADLAAVRERVAWLPAAGPRAFWAALDRAAADLNAALQASSRFNQLTALNRAAAALREIQAALPDYQKKPGKKSADEEVDLKQLRDLMVNTFDEEETRELAFALGADYETLPSLRREDKVRELVLYMQRQNRLPELVDRLAETRPQVFSALALQTAAQGVPFTSIEALRPIIGGWIRLIEAEVTQITAARQSGREIPNPYIPGTPIHPDGESVFKGRQDIFAEIERNLAALHQIPTLLLYGPRRSGKTSLLLQMPHRLPENVVPVFVNLQEAAATVHSAAGFVVELAQTIARQSLAHRRLTLPRVSPLDFAKEPYLAFARWLDEAARPLVGYTLFITFDEFEWVEKAIDQGRLDENVLSFFRNLIQRGGEPPLALLFSGIHLLSELKYNWPSYFINVKSVKVGYLPEADARRLITNPIEDFPLDYEPEALDLYLRQTRCQPYLVQLVGFELVNYLNSANRRAAGNHLRATVADLEAGLTQALAAGHNYFAELWQSGSDPERLALADLAAGAGLPAELDEGERLLTTRRLLRRDLIEEVDGAYRIQAPLVARWIREEYPPSLVRAEMKAAR